MRRCVLHPHREARQDAQGIFCCSECWLRYRDERRATSSGSITAPPFLQELVKARNEPWPEVIKAGAALIVVIVAYVVAFALGR